MVVVPTCSASRNKVKTKAMGIPIIDLSNQNKAQVSRLIVEACEQLGFFKVINHGVNQHLVKRMEEEAIHFFAKPFKEKKKAAGLFHGPLGFGCKSIGPNGDMGDLEYLLLHTNPLKVYHISKSIYNDPAIFSCAVNNYVESVKGLACEILDRAAEGLWVPDKFVFSKLIRDVDSDTLFRLNHYPAVKTERVSNIGFGEHTDPQILTMLTSNDVAGLQICLPDGLWVPVPPDPSAFYVIVGDTFKALTNGRFVSVRHRALSNSTKPRLSMAYFAAPALDAWISPLSHMASPQFPSVYKPFTWGEFKRVAYTMRLGDTRLDPFKIQNQVQD